MLLYGDAPPSGEPTLELLRRPLPPGPTGIDEGKAVVEQTLTSWGWATTVDAATGCLAAVLTALVDDVPETLELFAFRRAHQLTVEVHVTGLDALFHNILVDDPERARAGLIDSLAPLWGVRPLADGEAVWFEFR